MDDGVGVPPQSDIPDHVPPHLVRRWALASAPGAEVDPYAANKPLHDGPDIFYSPLMRSPTDSGAWVITRSKLIREVLTDPESFYSRDCSGLATLVGGNWSLIPLEIDPPDHLAYRMFLNPLFSPKRMSMMEPGIRRIAAKLIDETLPKGGCEFTEAFGRPFPSSIFLDLMGLPQDMVDQFIAWEITLLRGATFEVRAEGATAVRDYLVDVINERRARPKDDLISYTATARMEGRLLTDDEVLGVCFLMFVGGLDTVTSTLGFIFKHLAETPANQQRLRAQPEIIPAATEELLRAHAVVNSPRHVSEDMEFHGVQMKKGDRVVLAMVLAGRDAEEYDRPDTVDFDRPDARRHISFATGPHICIGQHLARREIRIALEEWIARAPPFAIKAGETPATHGMTVFGVDRLPLVWGA